MASWDGTDRPDRMPALTAAHMKDELLVQIEDDQIDVLEAHKPNSLYGLTR